MVNCSNLFKEFHDNIKLSGSKETSLKTSRDANRDRIKKYFKDKNWTEPNFKMQGSFKMKTVINPINDDEYDLDDGVYLNNLDSNKDNWKTPTTVHSWVVSAVENATSTTPEDKNKCVRVNYNNGYHIDLPIYCYDGEELYLAVKNSGWSVSDPSALRDWVLEKIKIEGEQLRRLIRYLKAWKDNQSWSSQKATPTGLILTILVANNFVYDTNDDESFLLTVADIINDLKDNRSVKNPVDTSEELIDDSYIDDIIKKLEQIITKGNQALEEEKISKASEYWRKIFDDRFPLKTTDDDKALKTKAPAVIGNDNRSA